MTAVLGKTHAAAGACAAAFVLQSTGAPPESFPLGVAVGALAALLPDIDEPNSTVSQHAVVIGPAIGRVVRHRTITHSLVALVGLVLLLRGIWPAIPPPVLYAAAAGFASHLVADAITPAGAMWFWPLSPVMVTLTGWLPGPLAAVFATGGALETHVFRPLFVAGAAWFVAKGVGLA